MTRTNYDAGLGGDFCQHIVRGCAFSLGPKFTLTGTLPADCYGRVSDFT